LRHFDRLGHLNVDGLILIEVLHDYLSFVDEFIDGVFHFFFGVADVRLHFADELIRLAFGFQFFVVDNFASGFLDGTLDLIDTTFNLIFVHSFVSFLQFDSCSAPAESAGSKGSLAPQGQYSYASAIGLSANSEITVGQHATPINAKNQDIKKPAQGRYFKRTERSFT